MSTSSGLKAQCDRNPHAALGRAVAYLMTKPNFETLTFGVWSRILVGQVNRGHYFFVYDGDTIVGFAGWALTSKDRALAWLNDNAPLPYEQSQSGDSMVINAWAADTNDVNRFVLRTLRKNAVDRNIYAKRFYSDGAVRPVILRPNKFIKNHIQSSR